MFSKFKSGLEKTRKGLFGAIGGLFGKKIDEDLLEQLEESLILADVGPIPTAQIIESLRKNTDGDPVEILRQDNIDRQAGLETD